MTVKMSLVEILAVLYSFKIQLCEQSSEKEHKLTSRNSVKYKKLNFYSND